jgi:hypothetical protein
MSPHEPKPGPKNDSHPRTGLSLSQLVASALAAASAAFAASFLGVAGTIVGAAVASVIATVASAMYTDSLNRTKEVVHSTVTQWSRTPASAPVVDPNAPDASEVEPDADAAARRMPWTRVAVAAVAVLAVTLGSLTAVEAVMGKPLATLVGGSDADGTSFGTVTGSGGSGTKAPRKPASPHATPSSKPSTTPSSDPSSDPSAGPTPQPGDHATEVPSDAPTTTPSAQPTTQPSSPGSTPPGVTGPE